MALALTTSLQTGCAGASPAETGEVSLRIDPDENARKTRRVVDYTSLPVAPERGADGANRRLDLAIAPAETLGVGGALPTETLCTLQGGGARAILANVRVGAHRCASGEPTVEWQGPCGQPRARQHDPAEIATRASGLAPNSMRRSSLTEWQIEGTFLTKPCTGALSITREVEARAIVDGLVYAYRLEVGSKAERLVLLMPPVEWVVASAEPMSDVVIERGAFTRVEVPVQAMTSTSVSARFPGQATREWLARTGLSFVLGPRESALAVEATVDLTWGHREEAPLAMATATQIIDGRRMDLVPRLERDGRNAAANPSHQQPKRRLTEEEP